MATECILWLYLVVMLQKLCRGRWRGGSVFYYPPSFAADPMLLSCTLRCTWLVEGEKIKKTFPTLAFNLLVSLLSRVAKFIQLSSKQLTIANYQRPQGITNSYLDFQLAITRKWVTILTSALGKLLFTL